MKNISYEWDIEELDITDPNDPQVLDHHHADKLPEFFTAGALIVDDEHELCLVRDDASRGGCREWAYVTEAGGLPEFFQDAHQRNGSKVPKRFCEEFARHAAQITFKKTAKP